MKTDSSVDMKQQMGADRVIAPARGPAAARRAPGRLRAGASAYLLRGVLVPSNAALVELAVSLAGALGREVATQEQPSHLLELS